MRKPSLEIRVDAVGGAADDVALDMTNLAQATNAVVICEYQPGVLLAAKPSDSALEVASQLPRCKRRDVASQRWDVIDPDDGSGSATANGSASTRIGSPHSLRRSEGSSAKATMRMYS